MKETPSQQQFAMGLRPLQAPSGIGFIFPDDDDSTDFSNEPTEFPCQYCTHAFVTRASLARHMVYHEDEILEEEQSQEDYIDGYNGMDYSNNTVEACSMCKQIFATKNELSQHISRSHGGAKFQCKICNRNASRRDHLKRYRLQLFFSRIILHLCKPTKMFFVFM